MQGLQKELKNTFFQTLEDLKTRENFEIFLNDFLDPNELQKLYKRLAIAYWFKKGRNSENIKNNIGVTNMEIQSVTSKINKPGYKLALKLMEAEE
jgi:uncharacterized protein YerC